MKHSPEFRTLQHPDIAQAINTKILKQTIRQVESDYKNYFKAVKTYHQNPAGFTGKPQFPGYKTTGNTGRTVCTIPQEALGFIKPKQKPRETTTATPQRFNQLKVGMTKIIFPTKTSKTNILEAKIVPCAQGYDFIISYSVDTRTSRQQQKNSKKLVLPNNQSSPTTGEPSTNKITKEPTKLELFQQLIQQNPDLKIASGDLGITNLLALTTNDPSVKPLIVDGCKFKAYNQGFNKKLAKLQAGLAKMNGKGTKKTISVLPVKSPTTAIEPKKPTQYTSQAIKRLYQHRQHYLDNALHVISKRITQWCGKNHVQVFILGYNQNWKTGVNLGRKTNQQFVQLPFLKLANRMEYKLANAGIVFLKTEESYTSKCSFFDQEPISQHQIYLGTRVHRGLFKTKLGKLIHADINGSLNIGKKVAGELAYHLWYASAVRGDAVIPVRIRYI